jgi:NitT/TauT family transport system ATP-binding protein
MISVNDITFGYSQQVPIFDRFSWVVEQSEIWSVVGPSGCGKTTLLYLLAGLRFPSAGWVEIHGERLTRPRPHTGLILQDYGLLPWATVRENAEIGLRIREFYGPDGKHAPVDFQPGGVLTSRVDYWLHRMGLAEQEDKYPSQISGGQRQRTAISRTLALNPDLLLTDEPFSALDAPTRESLQNLTLELCRENGITLIIVTHSIEEAAFLGKKILLLNQPPNLEPLVINNPDSGQTGFRETAHYAALCKELRSRMEPT